MKDIDFDELDQAVNSLAQGKQAAKPVAPVAQPQVQTSKTPTMPEMRSDQPSLVRNAAAIASRPATALVPALRSRVLAPRPAGQGRGVIDIMAPKPPVPQPAKATSRTGATLQPVSAPEELLSTQASVAAIPEQFAPSSPLVEAPKPELQSVQTPSMVQSEQWPDPLDFQDSAKKAEPTPFITGAKVEKRPLGAFATPALPAEPETPVQDAVPTSPADSFDFSKLGFESEEPAQPSQTPEPEPANQPIQPPLDQQLRESAMLSIPQQYQAAAKPADTAQRPVFDTKEYHPPLLESTAYGAHHHNRWLPLLVTLLVIAVLVVAGYVAFLYFMQP